MAPKNGLAWCVAGLLIGTGFCWGDALPAPAGSEGKELHSLATFERDVRPILKANCFQCHGEDEVEAGLDLRLVRTMRAGGDSGPAIVPGKAGDSLLYHRIIAGEMPPTEKKLSPREVAVIAGWIEQGARTARPEPESLATDGLTDEERSFWSFQPIRRPSLPGVHDGDEPAGPLARPAASVRSPIDHFLLAELERRGLAFSPPADKPTLVRRLSFDLVGLPPEPQLVEQFVADDSPDAYERLVDRLLASPHYGERWGRHWLDVAGYADSDGYSEKDLERKYAYRYRDHVIESFGRDKPWDEFIVEQLAGDELLSPPYANLTADQKERLIATGFLRMGPDGTGDGAVDQNVARNEVLAETIKIVSTSLLGLTVGCAQCHNHRYDPIPQLDYYRMRSIFEPAYDPKEWRTPQARLVSLRSDEEKRLAAQCDADVKRLEKERLGQYEELADQVRERAIADLPDELKDRVRQAVKTPVSQRTPAQKKLLTDYPRANVPSGGMLLERNAREEYRAITEEYARRLAEVNSRRPADDFAHCLTEVPGKVPTTYLFYRGEFSQPKQPVVPAELSVLGSVAPTSLPVDDESLPTTGRRMAYAQHLTSGRHPLVARVLVNRVWLHHFGRGIVATPGDFGHLGERPSHVELLDWLADEFMRGGWVTKRMHRLILASAAYRQSSRRRSELDAVDPDNRLLGRMPIRRLEAETIRDAILAVSGQLTRTVSGPPVPVAPDETGQIIVGVDTRDTAGRPTGRKVPLGAEEFRRSVYLQVRRTMPLAVLETFDAPEMRPNCTLRNDSTGTPQSLLLMNNDFVLAQAREFAGRVRAAAGADPAAMVRLAWQQAFGQPPTESQAQSGIAFLAGLQADLHSAKANSNTKTDPALSRVQALAGFCQALFSSNRFLYVE